ncbi:MAG: hypothetical protein ACXWWD_05250 [Chitinophagaceae bacterium]
MSVFTYQVKIKFAKSREWFFASYFKQHWLKAITDSRVEKAYYNLQLNIHMSKCALRFNE